MKRFNTPFPFVFCLLSFALLAACLFSGMDKTLFLGLNQLSQALPDAFWGFATTLADPIVAPLLVFSLFYRQQIFLRALFIAIILALVTNYSLKHGFGFERPADVLEMGTYNLIGSTPSSPSFPSGHTLTIFTLMGLISAWYKNRTISAAVFSLAAIISFSRISVGAHWPSDVLFGALLGGLIGWLAIEINSRLSRKLPEKLALAGYFIALFSGIYCLISKTAYPSGQWLSTAIALFCIAYSLRSITELLHREKG